MKRCDLSAGTEGQVRHLMVNGPKDVALDWDAIDWRCHEDNVRRLRQRIFNPPVHDRCIEERQRFLE